MVLRIRISIVKHMLLISDCAYLPEWLRRVLAGCPLEDLWSTWVLVDEFCHIIDLIVNDDPQASLRSLVVGNVLDRVCFRHGELCCGVRRVFWCGVKCAE